MGKHKIGVIPGDGIGPEITTATIGILEAVGFEADWVYYETARRVFPQTYRGMVGFRPAWFLQVDPKSSFPRYGCPSSFVSPISNGISASIADLSFPRAPSGSGRVATPNSSGTVA